VSQLKLFLFLLFPLFIFASPVTNEYAESFIRSFQEGNFLESLGSLDEWETFEPEQKRKIKSWERELDQRQRINPDFQKILFYIERKKAINWTPL
jgi:hypothetical protein